MAQEKWLYAIAELDNAAQRMLKRVAGALSDAGITGRQTPGIPYHITLGRYDVGAEDETRAMIEEACGRIRAFDISLGSMGLFGLNVLFASPGPSRKLLEMFDSFCTGNQYSNKQWTPHVTLLIDEPEVVMRALPIVNAHFVPGQARVVKVSLYEFFPKKLVIERKLL